MTYSVPSTISTPTIVVKNQYEKDNHPYNGSSHLIDFKCSDSSAEIHYTISGSTPTNHSLLYYPMEYTPVVKVDEGTIVKAVAYKNGMYSSVATRIISLSLSVNTNSQWEAYDCGLSSSSFYSYCSYSDDSIDNSTATMYLTISGYDTFVIYIRSNAESSYGYTKAYEVDSETIDKAETKGYQYSDGSNLSNYRKVIYTGLEGTTHTIRIDYKQDGSVDSRSDRGYLVIPKNQ